MMSEISRTSGRITVRMRSIRMGRDLCIAIYGGDREHIGAVALALSRPSLDDPGRVSATASVLAAGGHKEDLLARRVALELAAGLDAAVSVSCGIHLDNASSEEIREVQRLVDEMTAETVVAAGRGREQR